MKKLMLICFVAFVAIANVFAQSQAGTASEMTEAEFIASLNAQTGSITLPGNIATVALNDRFQYLSPESAERLLVDGWGNPPGHETLGMIIPTSVSPLSSEGWGVVIGYDKDGHVSDADADDIDYSDLLESMQEATQDANKRRKELGYPSMALVGWAEAPSYDKSTHKFYWAKELSADDSEQHSLNYNIRVLGREGVLVLNAVAGMNQIGMIKNEMPDLLAVTEFTQGNRYDDFDSKTDRVAGYGLAALVAGGAAAKLGLFAKIGALLIAFKKFIVIGIIASASLLRKYFSKKT